tara:strand:- start:463 stop:639 length:177 start_codon:yes stop_codon:yes gene_type:complete
MPILYQLLIAYLVGAGAGCFACYMGFGRYDIRKQSKPNNRSTFIPRPYVTIKSRKEVE